MAGIDRPDRLTVPCEQPRRGLSGTLKSHDEERPARQRGANLLGLNP
jgi:hypothetical protein